jgi:iron complex transport system substrate-binding protein
VDALEEVAAILHPGTFGAGAPKAAQTVQSPGFGAMALVGALFGVFLLRAKK